MEPPAASSRFLAAEVPARRTRTKAPGASLREHLRQLLQDEATSRGQAYDELIQTLHRSALQDFEEPLQDGGLTV
eukprot:CAMPEP_0178466174 /NCGR_PEP_ID=MMETSP0689_2-20121128/51762_1 /TAXON_ID=160604 /ORGANISM="Amphidinium massartii, Strain CS-259" /LENGTH=74 /DNA_ID=CAMNT_0020093179 /DNA_START=54 /DNA_END=275 /DNA_ORIENTATION=-